MTIETSPGADEPELRFVDTHCHLDHPEFADDLDEVIAASRKAGVRAWVNVGYAPDRWDTTIALSRRIVGMAHMLGLHPSHAHEWGPGLRQRLRDLIRSSGARAVGEIGLDLYRDNPPLPIQREALLGQLQLARDLGLPAVIHLRNAEDALIDALATQDSLPRLLFHSFDGTSQLTRFVLEHGALIGVGGLATRQRSAPLREQLVQVPLDAMVLETDAPYLIPARQRERRNTPAHVRTIAQFLSELIGRPVSEIAWRTTAAAERFFGRLVP